MYCCPSGGGSRKGALSDAAPYRKGVPRIECFSFCILLVFALVKTALHSSQEKKAKYQVLIAAAIMGNPVEKALQQLYAEVLSISEDSIGREDSFIGLGGKSSPELKPCPVMPEDLSLHAHGDYRQVIHSKQLSSSENAIS